MNAELDIGVLYNAVIDAIETYELPRKYNDIKDQQLLNATESTLMQDGKLAVINPLQLANADDKIISQIGKFTDVKQLHPVKARRPIILQDGKFIDGKAEQP